MVKTLERIGIGQFSSMIDNLGKNKMKLHIWMCDIFAFFSLKIDQDF